MTREAAEEILELPRRYTKEELRRCYTKLARTYHPDAAVRNHHDPAAAQQRMVEANKAYQLLKQQFVHDPDFVAVRDDAYGIGNSAASGSFAEVDWQEYAREANRASRAARAARAAARSPYADNFGATGPGATSGFGFDDSTNPWGFADEWGAESLPQKPPLSIRTVLLGPVLLRLVAIALLAWVWWRNFPLLPHNTARFMPDGEWTVTAIARFTAAFVYPTYLVVYETVSGYLSGLVREVLNGAVSWLVRKYVDLRPKSSSYGCALSKILREQAYALLMIPIVLYLAGMAVAEDSPIPKVMLAILAGIFLVDTLACCTHGGFVDMWSSALAERVEARYLLIRAALLRHCGQWDIHVPKI